ncbi:MAG: L-threonine 3-dehydrogenase [Euryarchaeota archaeon]|nr:L-threonine 3-dehydrogenase [Euryarchaeota archaeon]MDE1837226.1 L-threonine 3-dehydrogenase [Euryarchaeota archaeon]MDE1879837.1 L-threonine 3-dehydrogenase [Euryarchaeota archaeon]MDE2045170.1 L-threonine 3-dehydrogenase [Thermoplasmata archaeon]
MQAFVKSKRAPGGELQSVPDPRPGPNDVVVRVKAASVCGTDVHIWEWNRWAEHRVHRIPMILGHELSGEVVELGSAVRALEVGDHVSAETHIVDGTCYQCRTGRMHICENVQVFGVDRDGVFAEKAVLPELNAWKNDPKLDPALASIQEPLGNAVHCILPEDNVEDLAGKDVLVTGCGPIGLLAIPVAKTLGAARVVATEVNPLRISLAKKMGADVVFDPSEKGRDIAREVRDFLGGHGVDVALEMSGHPSSLRLVFDALRPGGRVSLLGLFSTEVPLDLDDGVIFKAARIHGIFGRRMFETWFTVKGLLAQPSFREKMYQIITHKVPIAELPRAMELIESLQAAKVSLTPKW